MSLHVQSYAWQAAIVGNARLGGLELRALMLEDPYAGVFRGAPDKPFRGFQVEGGFEPSFYAWLDSMKARGLVAIRSVEALDPADWVLTTPPPPLPRMPELVLVFPDRDVWYQHVFPWPGPDGKAKTPDECFREVPESRSSAVPSVEDAERELLAATRAYVDFVGARARADDTTEVFHAEMGRTALARLLDTEAQFRERLVALRDERLREYRRRAKDWYPVKPVTKAMRPLILENAAKNLQLDDYLRIMEAAGLSWRAVRLACAAENLHPLNMRHERTSEEQLPPFVNAPGYVAVGERFDRAARDARNAAVNAR
ncbi:hypothetical protein [Myxococcus sp. CA039A]|uniref:hypothetical protein n=1 Tax=Myxococcus sp. CA039A TaxID=2741737 RepID=UPI00157A9B36|nr:hypothetical protein [Myxococcus sp. CA039A]NTX54451.1 hypothetical protein [Myxococcus sp. CA039A]